MQHDEILTKVADAIRETVMCGPVPIGRQTRAMDVRGWDSLSHTSILIRIEDVFGITLPMERVLEAANVGDLIDLIVELRSRP